MIKINGFGAVVSLIIFVLIIWAAYCYGKNGKLWGFG